MENSKDTEPSDDLDILELYGCDDDPLDYMIEPGATVKLKGRNEETTVEELQNIL